MLKGAHFCAYDIPLCPTTATCVPKQIITWDTAKLLYHKNIKKKDYFCDSFICFYLDDYKFDSAKGAWSYPDGALRVLRHFAGTITPDFSTYQDFPEAIKIYNTFRMRSFGYWLGTKGIPVINNVRWGTEESFSYCFEGIEKSSIVCIGTVGGSPREKANRLRFENGLLKLVDVLSPKTILVYGSSNYPCFSAVKEMGITVLPYKSQTAEAFERRDENV